MKNADRDWLAQVYDTALDLEGKGRSRFPPVLLGRAVATLFLEPSTRTRVSFTLAARSLHADVVNLPPDTSSMIKGESLYDTLKTLEAEGVSYAVIRQKAEGELPTLAPRTSIHLLNAGEGTTEHPTQALGDVLALRQAVGSLKGLRICFYGDAAYSRVFSSSSCAFKLEGAKIAVCSMPELLPPKRHFRGRTFTSPSEAVRWADVLYGLRLQKERHARPIDFAAYARRFQIRCVPKGKWLMHAGPFNRGVEVSGDVVYSARSLILSQITRCFYARAALFVVLEMTAR